jgi:hypothetical protein
MFGAQSFVEFVEIFADFVRQDQEGSGETVAEGIQADSGFAFGGLGTCTELGISLVRSNLGFG